MVHDARISGVARWIAWMSTQMLCAKTLQSTSFIGPVSLLDPSSLPNCPLRSTGDRGDEAAMIATACKISAGCKEKEHAKELCLSLILI
jgi:hypothetical protein